MGAGVLGAKAISTGRLGALLTRLPQSQDIGIALLLILTITLMILPMPTVLVDGFIGINFGIAALLLMTAVYLKSPLDLSTLPGIILISTIFRLSLSITTTRLILSEGDAGAIVRTFGEFVIAGNIVVGLVVFLIITLVQFMVISKGSERVAEVGARFTLDALPGKQMAIDAELRNGDIGKAEARALRLRLGRESQLYGAMDGAMKFVKGDAIAGLIITAINLVGGILIGVMQRGLPIGVAGREYSLLTVGDALIAQIPALLMSITAATIVTRVASDTEQNLGRDITAQLFADQRALWLAAGLMVGMALLPGFPTLILLLLAGLFGALAWLRTRAQAVLAEEETREVQRTETQQSKTQDEEDGKAKEKADAEADAALSADARVALVVDPRRHERDASRAIVERARVELSERLGIVLPPIDVRPSVEMGSDVSRIDLDDVPTRFLHLRPGAWHVSADERLFLEEAGHEVEPAPFGGGFLADEGREAAENTGVKPMDLDAWISHNVREVMNAKMSTLIGVPEVKALLEANEGRYADLLREILSNLTLGIMTEVMRHLLSEGVGLRNLRLVLEALAAASPQHKDPDMLAEIVRVSLKRQISHAHSRSGSELPALMLGPSSEQVVLAALSASPGGVDGLPASLTDQLREQVTPFQGVRHGIEAEGGRPVVVTSLNARRAVRAVLRHCGITLPVLSQQEVSDEVKIRTLGVIDLTAPEPSAPPRTVEPTH